MRLLRRASTRYFLRHPWITLLAVLGVAVGVSVVISIDLANSSARRAFSLSSDAVAGRASHALVQTASGVPSALYAQLRQAGIRNIAPIVEGTVQTPSGRALRVLGIDPFAESVFRPWLAGGQGAGAPLLTPGVAAATPATRAPAGLETPSQADPDTFRILRGGVPHDVLLYALDVPERSAEALRGWLVMDIATAQEVLGTGDRLSRIDVLIESPTDTLGLARTVGTLAVLEPATNRSATLSQMTRAFELNLQALSLLAMVVGMFIIYNTTMFSVVQRRSVIGRLRALGLTQRALTWHVGIEVFAIGAVGTALGVLLGLALGQGMVRLVARTINDLYFVTEVQGVSVDPLVLVKGGLVGLLSTLAAAWGPIRQAVTQPVSVVLQRSGDEVRYGQKTSRYAIAGIVVLTMGFLLIMSSRTSIVVAYLGLLGLLLGWSLCVPRMIQVITFIIRRLLGKSSWLTMRMATEGVSASLSRTSVATAALMVAISATIGVGVMVQSFRGTVGTWLEQSLQADVYIQPPAEVFRRVDAHIDPALYDDLASIDGVEEAYGVLRTRVVDISGTSRDLAVVDLPRGRSETILLTEPPHSAFWDGFTGEDHVIISEPMAFRTGLAKGDSLALQTPLGPQMFLISGVFYDYASDLGILMMARTTFDRHFDEPRRSGLALSVTGGRDEVQAVIARAEARAEGRQALIVRSNERLRETSLEIFDQTFAITNVLRLLSIMVAFIGVLSALMALQMERRREMAVLRAVGMTRQEVTRVTLGQTSYLGLLAGIFAVPLGLLLAAVLIFVINKRSFGWTLQLTIEPALLVQAVVLAVVAALLAGLYPAWKSGRTAPAEALKDPL